MDRMKKNVLPQGHEDSCVHMTLDNLQDIIRESQKEDWHTFKRSSKHQYACRASYKHNLSIGMGWGLPLKEFQADWTAQLEVPGPHYNSVITYFYNSMPVYQRKCIDISNGLCYFPLPKEGKGFFSVDLVDYNFLKNFNKLIGKGEFEDYFEKSGIEIRE